MDIDRRARLALVRACWSRSRSRSPEPSASCRDCHHRRGRLLLSNSALYSGDGTARDTLMGSLCDEVTVAVEPGSVVWSWYGAPIRRLSRRHRQCRRQLQRDGRHHYGRRLFTAGATTAASGSKRRAWPIRRVRGSGGDDRRRQHDAHGQRRQIEVAIDAIGCRDLRRSPAGETQWTDSCPATPLAAALGKPRNDAIPGDFRRYADHRGHGHRIVVRGRGGIRAASVATSVDLRTFALAQPAQAIIDA